MQAHGSVAERCNIGPDEIARRRRTAIVFSIVAAVITLALVALHVPAAARVLIWPVAAATAITWLQVVHRFCVAFGALGLENFGRLGDQAPVDAAIRVADRRRALRLVAEGGAIGLVVAIVLVLLPL